jgi:hypothetical protein
MGHSIKGVEIFASGRHNGDSYSDGDLDEMVAAFNSLDYKPPLKSGHSEDRPGMPALGWVENVRRMGSKLVADFVNLPDIVYNYIKEGRFNTVSSEVYWNLKRGGKNYRRALKAVALLGAEIPAVAGLRPLHELFSANDGEVHASEAVRFHSQEDTEMTPEQIAELQAKVEAAEKAAAEERAKREAAEKQYAEQKTAREAEEKRRQEEQDRLKSLRKQIDNADAETQVKELSLRLDSAEKARKAEEARNIALEAELKEYRERAEKLAEQQRKDRIESVVKSCKIPALRTFVGQFLDLATRNGEQKVYSSDNQPLSGITAVEEFVKYANANVGRIFTVVSGELPADERRQQLGAMDSDGERVGVEVDRKVKAYMQEHGLKQADYSTAMKSVLDADPTLKEQYVRAQNRAA